MAAEFDNWWSTEEPTGRLALSMLESYDWLERRVETVAFISRHAIERRVTLDISTAEVSRLAIAAGVIGSTVLVPLGVFKKGLLLDFDLRDSTGRALAVVPSRTDAEAAAAAMVATITNPQQGVSAFPDWYRRLLVKIAREFPSEQDGRALSNPNLGGDTIALWSPAAEVATTAEVQQWRNLVASNDLLWSLMVNFTLNFMLMTSVDLAAARTIILKLRYREELGDVDSPNTLPADFGAYVSYLIPAPGVGVGRSQHFQLAVPEAMFVAAATLIGAVEEIKDGVKALPESASVEKYQRRLSPGRASIYTSGQHRGAYYAAAALYPDPRRFLVPASHSIFISALLLLGGAIAQSIGQHLTKADGAATEAAIVLLLAVPTVASAYLATSGEHEIVSDVHRVPRFVTGLSALIVATSASVLILHIASPILESIWYGSAAICISVFCAFRSRISRIRRTYRDVNGRASETRALTIRKFETS